MALTPDQIKEIQARQTQRRDDAIKEGDFEKTCAVINDIVQLEEVAEHQAQSPKQSDNTKTK